MTDSAVTDAAVIDAANVLYAELAWKDLGPDPFMQGARAVLEAAMPKIREEIAAEIEAGVSMDWSTIIRQVQEVTRDECTKIVRSGRTGE